jgi:CHASE3 domain sensor protein
MKITGRHIPQRAEFLSLLFVLVLVLFIATLSYRAWSAFGRRSEQYAITQQIVDGTNVLLSSLKDADTGTARVSIDGRGPLP